MFKLRPKYHYTPKTGYMNDPNGLVFDEKNGIYHLYYQYQEEIIPVNCIVQWGHATSKDLIKWTEESPVLSPDEYGIIMSGSAVVDEDNTSGLFSDETPKSNRLVAFYASGILGGRQAIALAYSTDGYNYTKYDGGKPILFNNDPNFNNDFRDAKVIRYKNGWLMAVGGGQLKLFYSENLLTWQFQSAVKNVISEDETIDNDLQILHKYLPYSNPYNEIMPCECPDIFPFEVCEETKWVILGGGVFYIVGDLLEVDGKITFKPCTGKKRFYYCNDFFAHEGEGYASQSFYNDKFGRRIVLTWLMDDTSKVQSDKLFNGAQSLPTQLNLVKEDGEYVLKVRWVDELKTRFKQCLKPHFNGLVFADLEWNSGSGAQFCISSLDQDITLSSKDGQVFVAVNGVKKIGFEEKSLNKASLVLDGMALSLIINDEMQYSTLVFGGNGEYFAQDNGKFKKIRYYKEK